MRTCLLRRTFQTGAGSDFGSGSGFGFGFGFGFGSGSGNCAGTDTKTTTATVTTAIATSVTVARRTLRPLLTATTQSAAAQTTTKTAVGVAFEPAQNQLRISSESPRNRFRSGSGRRIGASFDFITLIFNNKNWNRSIFWSICNPSEPAKWRKCGGEQENLRRNVRKNGLGTMRKCTEP